MNIIEILLDRITVARWRAQESWGNRYSTVATWWWQACIWLICRCPCGVKEHRLLVETLLKSAFINEPTYLRVCERLDYWPDRRILSPHFMAEANAVCERLDARG